MNTEQLIEKVKRLGHLVFEQDSKPFNLNLIGVRSKDMTPNTFNDTLHVLWKFRGHWNHLKFAFTTDPGLYYLQNPINVNGTIIMVPDQYRGVYKKGFHKGRPALEQVKPMKYWRDSNRDGKLDPIGEIFEEDASTNLHDAGINSTQVGKWSAGCQVTASDYDFDLLMYIVDKAVEHWGNSFTYTLIEE